MGFLIGTPVYRGAPRIFGMVVQEAPPSLHIRQFTVRILRTGTRYVRTPNHMVGRGCFFFECATALHLKVQRS